jgi:hypothetical protein
MSSIISRASPPISCIAVRFGERRRTIIGNDPNQPVAMQFNMPIILFHSRKRYKMHLIFNGSIEILLSEILK